ncbi:MAG: NAD(P)/FAD-dependent oxidoreductase [Nakamurella sp.]
MNPQDGPHNENDVLLAATYDVAVIGGAAAGLSAAVALGRFDQSVVVIDDAQPRNAAAGHVHNMLTRDGTPPAELYRLGRIEVERYGGLLVNGTVSAIHGSVGAFRVKLDNQVIGAQQITARRIIVTTGAWDELPDVPGLAQQWGKAVLHCPFCHGYEVRNQRLGVLATGPMAIHQAMMFRLLSPHVTVLAHTAPPTPEQGEDLAARGISVAAGVVAEVLSDAEGDHARLTGVRLTDGSRIELDAVVVASTVHARADFLAPLGLLPTEFSVNGHVIATRIETGLNGATAVPGVWIAGNITEPMAQVVSAAAAGLAAASAIIGDILTARPVGHHEKVLSIPMSMSASSSG